MKKTSTVVIKGGGGGGGGDTQMIQTGSVMLFLFCTANKMGTACILGTNIG